jgi:hypothetical protein
MPLTLTHPAGTLILAAKNVKVTAVLDAAGFAGVEPPIGIPRVKLDIHYGEQRLSADIAAKSVRKAVAQLEVAGPDGANVIIQGRLGYGGKIDEAGLVVQPRTPRPEAAGVSAAPSPP